MFVSCRFLRGSGDERSSREHLTEDLVNGSSGRPVRAICGGFAPSDFTVMHPACISRGMEAAPFGPDRAPMAVGTSR
jgi:hypothetical protein